MAFNHIDDKQATKVHWRWNVAASFGINASIGHFFSNTNNPSFFTGVLASVGAIWLSHKYILNILDDHDAISNKAAGQLFAVNTAMCAAIGTATNLVIAANQDKIIPFISNMAKNAGPLTEIIHKL